MSVQSRIFFSLLLLMAFCLIATASVNASAETVNSNGTGTPVITNNIQVRLLSEYRTITAGQQFTIALQQKIRPHWHTYWRNPGDSGEPTEVSWQLPDGWTVSDIQWPAPQRIPFGPLVNYGYSDEVLLLFSLKAPANLPTGTITITADAYWLVCEETCIPEEGQLSLTLEVADTPLKSNWFGLLEQARAALPRPLPWRTSMTLDDSILNIQIPLPEDSEIKQASYFPYHKDVIHNAAKQQLQRNAEGIVLTIPSAFAASKDRLDGIVVLQEQSADAVLTRAYLLDQDAAASVSSPASSTSAWLALLLAFAGGILLNLMPCVFPVLSIKALALVELAATDDRKQQGLTHGLLYTLGVLLGFILLALLLIALRGGGEAIGWGFQLQNPWVVLLLCWLFFAIGLNLSGLFNFSSRFSGAGQSLTEGSGNKQSFFTGLLATLVATPCTAPFMGVAMGYALLQPAWLMLFIFTALGLGMAMPMALLSVFPGWLRFMPTPGVWMERIKEFFAFPMYLSAVWMLWVLQSQVGDQGILIGGSGLVVLGLLIWSGKLQRPLLRRISYTISIFILATLLAVTTARSGNNESPSIAEGWQTYSPEKLSEARQQGPVFVNFTADWCITCKVNEQVAMTQKVAQLFEEKGVTRLLADWTSRDPQIARSIELHGRSGVPLYLWYAGVEVTEAEILPQLLTEHMLISRLESLP